MGEWCSVVASGAPEIAGADGAETMARRDLDGCAKEAATASRERSGRGDIPVGRFAGAPGEGMWRKETNGVVVVAPIVVGPLFRLERVRSKHGRPWGEFAERSDPRTRRVAVYLRRSFTCESLGYLT